MNPTPLSGSTRRFPFNGKRLVRNIKFDFIAAVLFFGVAAYGLTAWQMNTILPFAPIATGSMDPEIKQGSLAIVRRVPIATIKVGDIIVFTVPQETRPTSYPIRLAHRVIRVEKDPAAGIVFWTKGDALEVEDLFGTRARFVECRVASSIPAAGHLWLFLLSGPGRNFLLFVGVVTIIFVVERPLRAIATGRINDPDLIAAIKETAAANREFAENFRSHIALIREMAELQRGQAAAAQKLAAAADRIAPQTVGATAILEEIASGDPKSHGEDAETKSAPPPLDVIPSWLLWPKLPRSSAKDADVLRQYHEEMERRLRDYPL